MARFSWWLQPTVRCRRRANTCSWLVQVGVPYIVVALNKCDAVDDPELLDLVELEVRELLKSYKFPATTCRLIRLSALGALNGEEKWEEADRRADGSGRQERAAAGARTGQGRSLMADRRYLLDSRRGTVVTGHRRAR